MEQCWDQRSWSLRIDLMGDLINNDPATPVVLTYFNHVGMCESALDWDNG